MNRYRISFNMGGMNALILVYDYRPLQDGPPADLYYLAYAECVKRRCPTPEGADEYRVDLIPSEFDPNDILEAVDIVRIR